MKKRLLQSLARLASIEYQEAYIVRATADEYTLPEDLVEDVASLCALATRNQYSDKFSADELSKLSEMSELIRKYGKSLFDESTRMDVRALIYKSKNWAALRNGAVQCLSVFRVEILNLTPKQIDEIK